MTRRFPKTVRFQIRKSDTREDNLYWELRGHRDGLIVAYGWTGDGIGAAREQAWNALEECGLVVDA